MLKQRSAASSQALRLFIINNSGENVKRRRFMTLSVCICLLYGIYIYIYIYIIALAVRYHTNNSMKEFGGERLARKEKPSVSRPKGRRLTPEGMFYMA